jgi:ceramide glucosyltransferase
VFWFWFFAAPALVLAFLSLRGERKRAAYVASRLEQPAPEVLPPTTLIVPVKGQDEGLRENLASLAALDYPDYELLVVARTAEDIPVGVLPDGARVLLTPEGDANTAEKLWNLQAGVAMSRKGSSVIAFADSDGRVAKGWLRSLVAPLFEQGVGASTGYRWYIPEPPDFWSLIRSVWNAPIAGLPGPGDNPFAWGGAMALRREVFYAADVEQYWKNTVSDDYGLSDAVHAAGLRIAFAPGAMVACTDHTSAREFFRWARRQMVITRVYRPRLWWQALVAHVFYCGGMAAALAASILGSRIAEWILIAQLSPGMLKAANRAVLARAELPEYKPWFARHGWVHAWWAPLGTWVWLAVLLSSAFSGKIEWRGVRYHVSRQGCRRL